jgi:PPOX class probable F420-dependent enzyme
VRFSDEQCWARLHAAEHGVLCTVHPARAVDAVPVCFAVVGAVIATPVDRVKAKDTVELARLANLAHDPRAALLCEHWDRDDWSQLWWVRAHLHHRPADDVSARHGDECQKALREKYPQYADTTFARVLVFNVTLVAGWSAAEEIAPA